MRMFNRPKCPQSLVSPTLHSAIYTGTVRHRRYRPKSHDFTYDVFMVYLDLQEVDQVFAQSRWWSQERFALAEFRRKDFFDGEENTSLYNVVADKVEQTLGNRPEGPIRMLTNLRYFGFIINPITCYYCFDHTGEQLQTVVAEVTNTPWRERCHYVLDCTTPQSALSSVDKQHFVFDKIMHVSPFQPMDLIYHWRGKTPTNDLLIHMDVYQADSDSNSNNAIFDATLVLQRHEMTTKTMNNVIWRYPWMTMKVGVAIYWQALLLWLKRIPFVSHPSAKPIANKSP
jgi:uncharacterized protein